LRGAQGFTIRGTATSAGKGRVTVDIPARFRPCDRLQGTKRGDRSDGRAQGRRRISTAGALLN